MQIQSQINQEIQLRLLFDQNQNLYKKRADKLHSKLQMLLESNSQLDLVQNTHLPSLIKYIHDIGQKRRKQSRSQMMNQQQSYENVQEKIREENVMVASQIQKITRDIEEIKQITWKYQLAQKYTSTKILAAEDVLNHHNFDLDLIRELNNPQQIPSLMLFAYDEQLDGSYRFKESYKGIIAHFFDRLIQNQETIWKLENIIREKVQHAQKIRVNIMRLKSMEQQYHETMTSTTKLKNLCEHSKQELITYLKNIEDKIQKKLPNEIDQSVKQILSINLSYEKAYHSILEVVKRVINRAEIDKVNEHINKQ